MGGRRGSRPTFPLMILAILAFSAALFAGARAQAQAPGSTSPPAAEDCETELFSNLAGCLDYVTNGSVKTPSKDCCVGLTTVVDQNPICLCSLLGGDGVGGIAINMTQALLLPKACKASTPDPSLCSMINGTSPSPSAGGPVSSSGSSTTLSPKGSGTAAPRFETCTGLLLAVIFIVVLQLF